MKYEVEKLKGEVKFSFTFDSSEWEEQLNKAYLKEKSKINVPGFRKGQAPRKIVERMYGKSFFYEDAINGAIYDGYTKALEEHSDVYPVDEPKVENVDLKDGGLVFDLTVTVRPEVKLGDYKGIEVEKVSYPVSDADVDAEINKTREQGARRIQVVDRAVANGDIVTLDYKGTVDGVAFEGGTASNQELVIGSNTFIPGFEDQMVGMAKGETKDLHVTFPAEYHAKELAGKEAVFTVTVNNIEVKELPEVNDDFAKEVSKFDNLADYKADVKAKLIEQNDRRAERENENSLLTKVVENAQVDIPDVMIEKQIDYIVSDTENQLKYMYGGVKFDDYLKYAGLTREEFRANNKERATRDVKSRLVFEEILKAEKIEATEEDLDKEIQPLADSAKKSLDEYKKTMDHNHLDYLRNEALMNKLVAFLKENNVFTDKAEDKKPAKKSAKKSEDKKEEEKAEEKKPAAKKTTAKKSAAKKAKDNE